MKRPITPRSKAVLAVVVVLTGVIAAVFGTRVVYKMVRPEYVLNAAFVTAEPKLDGIANEEVWSKAEEVEIPVEDGSPVTIKAVYTSDKVFFQVRFRDGTKNDIEQPWAFNGKEWRRGASADQFALFFDINQSVKDFDTKGFGVMNAGFRKNSPVWDFGIKVKQVPGKEWSGANQKGDLMVIGPFIAEPFGTGDDAYFGVGPTYDLSRDTEPAHVFVQWDMFSNTKVIQKNINAWQQAIKTSDKKVVTKEETEASARPYLKYRDPTQNLKTNPYPFESQLTEITGSDTFKKGDTLPFIFYGNESGGLWGGSRDDIKGKMVYEDSYWTLEMSRKLDTGYIDDIKFLPKSGKPVWFGALLRLDGVNVLRSEPARLMFLEKEG